MGRVLLLQAHPQQAGTGAAAPQPQPRQRLALALVGSTCGLRQRQVSVFSVVRCKPPSATAFLCQEISFWSNIPQRGWGCDLCDSTWFPACPEDIPSGAAGALSPEPCV